MSNWNLPPGCTDRMVDEAFGYSSDRREYQIVVTRTVEESVTLWIEADSEDEARDDALDQASAATGWKQKDDYDYEVESVVGPEDDEEDPDDARDARADYEFERDR